MPRMGLALICISLSSEGRPEILLDGLSGRSFLASVLHLLGNEGSQKLPGWISLKPVIYLDFRHMIDEFCGNLLGFTPP